ncbi:MAG: DUF2437 domain-containing protein [Deferribacteraceae bacterium]|nr:DUF2437 domain-containing protein [Deferribacteraceae bacterium]
MTRFRYDSNVEMKGIIDGDRVVRIHGSIFGGYSVTSEIFPISEVIFLPPVLPQTIICIGDGYSYMKSPSSLAGSGATVKLAEGMTVNCVKRRAYVVKDHQGNALGAMDMLDIVYFPSYGDGLSSSRGHTVLGRYIDDSIDDCGIIKDVLGQIALIPGDIVAVEMELLSCKAGDSLEYNTAVAKLV